MPPNLLNRARSSSDGSQTPLGWEWTVPTTEKSAGSGWSWKIAWRFPLTGPGTRMRSAIVPSSARRIAPNSRGYMSRDASKIVRKDLRAIAGTRLIGPPDCRDRDKHAVRAHTLHHLLAQSNLEVADLRNLSGVDDRLVRAVEHPLPVHGDLEPHSLFDLVVPARDPVQVFVDLFRVDLREETERPRGDSEDLRVRELEGPQDRAISADRQDDVRFHVAQAHPIAAEDACQIRLEEDFVSGFEPPHDVLRGVQGARDVRIRGDADLHRIASHARRSPTATRSVLAFDSRGRSSSRPFRSSTNPPASRTINVPAAMSTARSFVPTTALCM